MIPGLGRSPGEGKGYLLQYSGLENSMGCVVHGVAKSQTQLNDFHFHFSLSKEARYSKLRNLAFFTLGTMLPSGLTEMTLFICISAIWARILSFSHPEFLSVLILLKCCTQYASKSGKLSSGHRTGKGQFSLQSQRRVMSKNVQTTTQLHSFHTLAK